MRRSTGAAAVTVALTAIVPLSDPALALAQDGDTPGTQLPTISATSRPRPEATPPLPPPSPVAPTLGTQGGLGSTSTGPTALDIGLGLACVLSAAFATGYVVRRRRV